MGIRETKIFADLYCKLKSQNEDEILLLEKQKDVMQCRINMRKNKDIFLLIYREFRLAEDSISLEEFKTQIQSYINNTQIVR